MGRLRVIESNYGRDGGWYVEAGGRRLAALTDCRYGDMFWDSYRLEPLTDDPHELGRLYSDDFWDHTELVFRSREFGEVVPGAFPSLEAGRLLRETGRVRVRGLYLETPEYPWDDLLLWLRRRWRAARPGPTTPS